MDKGTVIGLGVALGGIIFGNMLEGGHISELTQPIAMVIVAGGTIGATMIGVPFDTFLRALKSMGQIFNEPPSHSKGIVDEIVGYATVARRDGILALETVAAKASDPFLARALMMAVDGADSTTMRESLEPAIGHIEENGEDIAKVFEAAGGYAPTIGIIGAVLGLIQVMGNLSDIAKVGHGIASAFVATVYGLVIANIICLPAANKLKLRTREAVAAKELMLEGALAIQQGMNPKLIKERLSSLGGGESESKSGEGAKEQANAAA